LVLDFSLGFSHFMGYKKFDSHEKTMIELGVVVCKQAKLGEKMAF
jgi:hypothetical protein